MIKQEIEQINKDTEQIREIKNEILNLPEYPFIENDLRIVLDFVESWNKEDKEQEVAQAAQNLRKVITKCEVCGDTGRVWIKEDETRECICQKKPERDDLENDEDR